MSEVRNRTAEELQSGLEAVMQSPRDTGSLDLIVRRPERDARDVIEHGRLDSREGLVGDRWSKGRSSRTPDGEPDPDTQLTIMNTRVIRLLAPSPDRWALAGDQLFVDMDLSAENLPPGTRLGIGQAVVEVTWQPHTGCSKFAARFGPDALRLVNTTEGRALRLRGLYARVIVPGEIRRGDVVRKLSSKG